MRKSGRFDTVILLAKEVKIYEKLIINTNSLMCPAISHAVDLMTLFEISYS
jgi:hypothetical protein